MNKIFGTVYFRITIAYVILIILIPIIVIFISNTFVINKIIKANSKKKAVTIECKMKRKSKHNNPLWVSIKVDLKNSKVSSALLERTKSQRANEKITSQEKTEYQMMKTLRKNDKDRSKKITKLLILISFKYALLNLPYLITWSIFYYKVAFNDAYFSTTNYLFAGKFRNV